jgi:predicted nucleic acid-binding protein
MSRTPVWYWDSCVILGLLKNERDKVHVLRHLFHQAENGGAKIVVSAWTFFEILYIDEGRTLTEKIESTIRGFFERDCFEVRNLDRRVANLGRELIWKCAKEKIKLSPKDAPHVATAAMLNVDVLHTYDPTLLSLDGKVQREDGVALRIQSPSLPQMPLALGDVN